MKKFNIKIKFLFFLFFYIGFLFCLFTALFSNNISSTFFYYLSKMLYSCLPLQINTILSVNGHSGIVTIHTSILIVVIFYILSFVHLYLFCLFFKNLLFYYELNLFLEIISYYTIVFFLLLFFCIHLYLFICFTIWGCISLFVMSYPYIQFGIGVEESIQAFFVIYFYVSSLFFIPFIWLMHEVKKWRRKS